jgi:orotate phosphoribosyltransferase
MTGSTLAAFLELARSRPGHFRLESGHHAGLWLDLDALFAEPGAIAPFVRSLTDELQRHAVDAVCGPLLGGAFLAQLIAQNLGTTFCFTEPHASVSGGLYGTRYVLPRAY